MILPIVHMNGTSKRELIQLRCDAANAVNRAIEALSVMSPNGRDYYPKPGLLEQAMQQHGRRLKALRDLYLELNEEAVAIDGGED